MKKRKFLLIALAAVLALILSGCGQSGGSKSVKAEKKSVYFENNICETKDLKIEITDVKVIQPGATGNEYGEKPVLAFWYKITNKTGIDVDPTSAWVDTFRAFQDTDADQVNELDVSMAPDEQYLDTQSEVIKKGGTAENAMGYELDDSETPVVLKAVDFNSDKEIGSQKYTIK